MERLVRGSAFTVVLLNSPEPDFEVGDAVFAGDPVEVSVIYIRESILKTMLSRHWVERVVGRLDSKS